MYQSVYSGGDMNAADAFNTVNSYNVSNYSANQPAPQLPTQLPALSVSAFAPSYTPGSVNAPFATPYQIPFSAPALQRQFQISGMGPTLTQGPATRATDNFSCSVVTVNGLEPGMGCTVQNGSSAAVTVDLSGTNPYTFANGANNIMVVGDAQSQMCNVKYSDAFDTSSFDLRPNGRFDVCI